MRLNIDLNEELGIRIFSFPMRYQPTDMKDRSHVGANWKKYYLRSMQIILQATHGIVSGSPDFFRRAFGESPEDFERLLLLPQHFLFNRDWYQHHDGKAEYEAFDAEFARLSADECGELGHLLSGVALSEFPGLIGQSSSVAVNRILSYYVMPSREEQHAIWAAMKTRPRVGPADDPNIPEDELVEDAGLTEVI